MKPSLHYAWFPTNITFLLLIISLSLGNLAIPAHASGQEQTIRVGLFENKPMCYTDEQGKAAGIFITVLEYAAAQEGWHLEFNKGVWSELRSQLEAGTIDILPSMAFSEERAKLYVFNSRDVFNNWAEVYVKKNSDIHSLLDLKGKKIATVQRAIFTTGPEGILKLNERFALAAEIIEVGQFTDAMQAVSAGKADAAVVNRLIGGLYQDQYNLIKSGIVFSPVRIRFGLSRANKHSETLARKLDHHIQSLKQDNHSAYHQAITAALERNPPSSMKVPRWVILSVVISASLVLALLTLTFFLRWQVQKRTRALQKANAVLQEDIQKRLVVEKALRQSQARFESLAKNSSDWIWEFDVDTIFTYTSPRIKDLLGYTPEEVIGKSAFDLIPLPERKKVAEEFMPMMEARQSFSNLENVNQHKDGRLIILESSGVPIFDENGGFCGYRGIDRDITERKNMEAKLRQAYKMEAIGTLAGGIAHDFNNILSAILGYADLAREDLEKENPAQEMLEEIFKAGLRAKELVKQILTFSRQSESKMAPVKISSILKEAIKLLRASIPTSIDIVQDIDDQACIINADPTQIHQVIINLCTNASHAMEETGGEMRISLQNVEVTPDHPAPDQGMAPGSYVELAVNDCGPGITPGLRKRIFDPYFTTKGIGKGTGLGLSVLHGIVLDHGGQVIVDSEVGKGATFRIFFPCITESGPEFTHNALLPKGGNEHILLVDDEEMVAEVSRKILERLGYQVSLEKDSLKALENFRANPGKFDLVVTDQTMPGMSGCELTKELIAIRPDIPIILCTGFSSQVDESKAREIGIQDFALKPLAIEDFGILIKKVLETNKSTDQRNSE